VAARLRLGAALGTLVFLSACVVGPNYVSPRSQMPARFVEHASGLSRDEGTVGTRWWEAGFRDPVLDQLVAEALRSSPTLQIASDRIVAAREELAEVSTEDLPQVAAQGAYARQHGSKNVPIGTPPGGLGPDINSNLWLAGFDMSWEVDLFGGTRRAIESVSASASATVADGQEAELSLVAEVVRDYVALRTEQRLLGIAEQIRASRHTDLQLVMARFDSGLTGALDAARARADLADSEAQIPAIEAAVRASIYRLGTLIGRPPETLLPLLIRPLPVPTVHGQVPVGLPSDLLERRPDIRAAERRVAAANARIGMREAELFPQFSLTGVAGLESLDAGDFVSGGSRYFAIGPSITWQVFDAGRIRDQVMVERAHTDVASARYRETVLRALDEVETALVTFGRSQISRNALHQEVAARLQALEIAQRLYARGIESFLSVLDAERTLYASQMSLATADQTTTDSYVTLIKALGGGWDNTKCNPPKEGS
jgi:outer membrane protein, multidrug efflux system